MNIQEQVARYYILGSLLSFIAIFTLLRFAPSFFTLIVFFWSLFLSTALFLTVVAGGGFGVVVADDVIKEFLFGNTNQSHPNDVVPPFPKPAEELLDYVAGHNHPEPPSGDNSDWKEVPLKRE